MMTDNEFRRFQRNAFFSSVFNEKLKEWKKKESGNTQARFAKLIGVGDEKIISRYKSGETFPTRHLGAICDVFGCDKEDFFCFPVTDTEVFEKIQAAMDNGGEAAAKECREKIAEQTHFASGAVRDKSEGKGRMDLLPWMGIIEVAKHCENGAKHYGEHNVDKGIPEWSLISSAARHLGQYIAGMTNEDHLRAAAWNILWALEQRTTHPELNTLHDWRKTDEA